MIEIVKFSISLLPVIVFLVALISLDSYKLFSLRSILVCIFAGFFSAFLAMLFNNIFIDWFGIGIKDFLRFITPIVEEISKSLYLIFLFKTKRVGFSVDATIYGFAIGTGFAVIENIYYLHSLTSTNIALWVLRGFGTAIMHGSTVAIMAMITNFLSYFKKSTSMAVFIPGLLSSIFIHICFNMFFLPPVYYTVIILIIFPSLVIIVFKKSEKATRNWLGVGMDTDVELLETITSGLIRETKIGIYLDSIKSKFDKLIVADMLCYLRIHLELAVGAKGLLLMRSAGFEVNPDSQIKSKLEELNYLEKSIGKTGKLAISALIYSTNRDIWQLRLLDK